MNGVQASIPKYRQNAQFLSAQGFVNPSAPPYSLNTPVYRTTGIPTTFIPNYTSSSSQKRNQILNYYKTVTPQTESTQPITISWHIDAYVREKKDGALKRCCNKIKKIEEIEKPVKNILKNVNGIVKPGQLCAIMGASGAGKTTLLNVLNFRNQGKLETNGDVKINGQSVNWKTVASCSGYVQQDDVFIGTLKVREHLTFLAILKMGQHLTKAEKLERVEQVLLEMNLVHVQDTYIGQGDRLRGISGGEKRRLAFASEVLTNPPLLFCDEPTSGLDSFMAQSIVDSMSVLAKQGKTIISTIHQPSSQIFEKFDTLCLLSEGRVAYMGPSKEAISFFKGIGEPVPNLYNPSDHYINVLAILPNSREECLKKSNAICDRFERSQINLSIMKSISDTDLKQIQNPQEFKPPSFNASYLTQITWLLWRQSLISIREPIAGTILLGQTIIVGLFLGFIYLNLKNDYIDVQNRLGLLLILQLQTSFSYIFPVINTFPSELKVFYRETKNKVYSTFPYYMAKQLAELPKFIVLPFLLTTITYWMANIRNDGATYIIIVSFFILSAQVALGFGILSSIIAPNEEAAVGIAAPLLLPLLIFSGYFLNNVSAQDWLVWFKYISFFYYAYDAVNIQLWKDYGPIECSLPGSRLVNGTICPNELCFATGTEVLKSFQFNVNNFNRDIGLLFALIVVPRVLGYIVLKIKSSRL